MPRVPVYDQPGVVSNRINIGAAPIAYDRTSAHTSRAGEIVAGALGDAAGGAADGLAKVRKEQEKERDKANTTALMTAEAEFEKRLARRQWDRNEGILQMQGENALKQSEPFYAMVEKDREELAKTITDPRARQVFLARAGEISTRARVQTERHVGGEIEKLHKQGFESLLGAKLDVAKRADPETFAETLRQLENPLHAEAARRGLSTARVPGGKSPAQEFVEQMKGAAYEARLQGLIESRDGQGARAFFEQNRDKLGAAAKKYEGTVKALALGEEVEATAADIIAQAVPDGGGWVDAERALARVETLPDSDPEKKQEVRRLVEHQVRQNEQQRAREVDKNLNNAWSIYDETRNLNDPRLATVGAWLRENGAAQEWVRFREHAERQIKASRARPGRPSRSDEAAARREQARLNREALNEYKALDPEERINLDVGAHFGGLGADRATVLQIVALQKKDQKAVEGGGVASEAESRRMALAAAGNLVTSARQKAQFLGAVTDWHARFVEENKRQPTMKDARLFVGEMMLLGDSDDLPFGLSKNKRRFEVKRGEKFKPFDAEDQDSVTAAEFLRSQQTPAQEAAQPTDPKEIVRQIRAQHPTWTKDEVRAELARRQR